MHYFAILFIVHIQTTYILLEININSLLFVLQQTIRVTVNMPRGVKSLQRLNPNIPIMDIFRKICLEKGLDPSRYEVRLTKQPQSTVDMSQTLSDYQANEITIRQCAGKI